MTRRGFLLSIVAGLIAGTPQSASIAQRRPLPRFSPRERQVLALQARGWSDVQIGRELLISLHTVRVYKENILLKIQMAAAPDRYA